MCTNSWKEAKKVMAKAVCERSWTRRECEREGIEGSDGRTYITIICVHVHVYDYNIIVKTCKTDRRADRQTDEQTDR